MFAHNKFRMDFNWNKWFWLFISVYGNLLYWIYKKKRLQEFKITNLIFKFNGFSTHLTPNLHHIVTLIAIARNT